MTRKVLLPYPDSPVPKSLMDWGQKLVQKLKRELESPEVVVEVLPSMVVLWDSDNAVPDGWEEIALPLVTIDGHDRKYMRKL